MTRDWSPSTTTAVLTALAAAAALALTAAVPVPVHGPPWRDVPTRIVHLIRLETFFTSFNFLLVLGLTAIYAALYRELPNKYTVSLLLLSLALLLYAFTSNPIVHLLVGFRPRPNIGAFVFVPDLFVSIAVVVLLYQSQT